MEVIAGRAHPTLSTWIAWGIMDVAILVGMILAGEIAWQVVAYVVGVAVVFTASAWKGASVGWTLLDLGCLAVVALAVIFYLLSKKPAVLIIISLIGMTIGTIPTIVSMWNDPMREPLLPWLLFMAGGICGMLAVKEWRSIALASPTCFLVLQVLVLVLMFR